jgi:potassium efflux system protein
MFLFHNTRWFVFFSMVVVLFGALVGSPAIGDESTQKANEKTVQATPGLAEVVDRAGDLGLQLSQLKNKEITSINLEKLTDRLLRSGAMADFLAKRFTQIKQDDLQSFQQMATIIGEARIEIDNLEQLSDSFTQAMRELEDQRQNWLTEERRWNLWQDQMVVDMAIQSVADAFVQAKVSIDQALAIIARNLEPLLEIQQKASAVEAKIRNLTYEIETRMDQQRGDTLRGGMPTMFSAAYWQTLSNLAKQPESLVRAAPSIDPIFFRKKGWVIALQTVVFFIVFSLVRRYQQQLSEMPNCRFIVERPIALSFFVIIFTLSFLYESPPTLWRALIQTIAGIATARLVSVLVSEFWIKQAVFILITVMIAFQLMLIAEVPVAAIRFLILIWSVPGIIYFGWQIHRAPASSKPNLRTWLLWLIVGLFTVIAVTNFFGFGIFAVQLMEGAIRSSILLMMGWAMMRVVRSGLSLGIKLLPFHQAPFIQRHTSSILQRINVFATVLIAAVLIANLLVAWKVFAIPMEALQAFFSFGIHIGEQRVSIGLITTAALILYGAFILSWGLQALLMESVLPRRNMDTGTQVSIVRLVHYSFMLVGFLMALSALGFELKNVTIIGGALGIGIGFGMQAIVNNFVSGLILLFERPIKVGDVIQLSDGQRGRVTNLGLRATTVQTFSRSEIVVPNGDLIANQVTNWTLGDRGMRLELPIGVAYGSDVETVIRLLTQVANENPSVLGDPPPVALFLSFGESSLDFELRVWIADFNERRIIQSDLIRGIDRQFRIAGIEIPFPQRDLHIRSVDEKASESLHRSHQLNTDEIGNQ